MISLYDLCESGFKLYKQMENDRMGSILDVATRTTLNLPILNTKAYKLENILNKSNRDNYDQQKDVLAQDIIHLRDEDNEVKADKCVKLKNVVGILALCAEVETQKKTAEEASQAIHSLYPIFIKEFEPVVGHTDFWKIVADFLFEKIGLEKNALVTKNSENTLKEAQEELSKQQQGFFDTLRWEKEKLEEKVGQLLHQEEQLKSQFDKNLTEIEAKLLKLIKQEQQLKTQIENHHQDMNTKNREIVSLRGTLQAAQQELKKAKETTTLLKTNLQHLTAELKDQQLLVEQQKGENGDLKTELEVQKVQYSRAIEERNRVNKTNLEFKRQLDQEQKEHEKTKNKLSSLREQTQNFRQFASSAKNTNPVSQQAKEMKNMGYVKLK